MKKLLVVLALVAVAAGEAHAAKIVGVWKADRGDDGSVHLSLSRDRWGMFGIGTVQEIEAADLDATVPRSVGFERVAPAGRLTFEGTVSDGRGAGIFEFEPDPRFNEQMAVLGYEPFSDEQLLVFAGRRFAPSVVRDLQRMGYEPDRDDVVKIAVFDVDAAYARAIAAAGLGRLSLDELVRLRVGRITPAKVRDYKALHLGALDADEVAQLGIMGATPDYIRDLRGAGVAIGDPDDAVRLRVGNVTVEIVGEYRKLGYSHLSADQLSRMGMFDVTPEYIRELRSIGRGDLSAEDVVKRKIRERVVESVEQRHRNDR